jgi:hypothetical protein
MVTATTRATPRIACSAATTGAIGPTRQELLGLPRQPVELGFRVLDGVNVILQHDLLRWMGKAHRRQPATVSQGPRTNPWVDLTMAQQKALHMLACLGEHSACRRSGAHQIAHGFMGSVGDPDRRQLAGTVRFGQHQRIAAIGLHPVACLSG